MNSSATRAHLQNKLAKVATSYERNRRIALRPWKQSGSEVRKFHLKEAGLALKQLARLELAIIYLGMRIERGHS